MLRKRHESNPRTQYHKPRYPKFQGHVFYEQYKEAEFLQISDNVTNILTRRSMLLQHMHPKKPGTVVPFRGMKITRSMPLTIKKDGLSCGILPKDFTCNRLMGLTAAYALEHKDIYPKLLVPEALELGLSWVVQDEESCRLYLSCLPGTEHFSDQFSFYPLLCALWKLKLKKISIEAVGRVANVRNRAGKSLKDILLKHKELVVPNLWAKFPGSAKRDWSTLLAEVTESSMGDS